MFFFFLIDRIAESLTLEILHEREFLDFLEILKCLVSCDAQRTWTFVGVPSPVRGEVLSSMNTSRVCRDGREGFLTRG